ncbi:MAG: DUF1634 domain-containing protein [Candidatus Methanoplasma sp.]|nr:DUF1634 domain-containing protein [Candidatus Methanoplasma sp.]
MRTNSATSIALRYCLFAGIALAAAGLVLSEHELGDAIMWTGLLILIASPFIGVLVSCSFLIAERDWKWAKVATLLTVLILVFLAASLLWSGG